MLNSAKTGLLIFDQFEIDWKLPKHKRDQENKIGFDSGGMTPLVGMANSQNFISIDGSGIINAPAGDWIDQTINQRIEMSKRTWKRLLKFLFGWLIPKPKPKLTVIDFFKNVKSTLQSPEIYADKINHFLKVADHAKKMGQTALFEQIMHDMENVKLEALLLQSNAKTCITEDQIVNFYKDCEKGLGLCFIKNFSRVIPEEVLKLKEKADELKVFDNYVVLYFDPKNKTFKETQAEIVKRKDPILFGVIRNVRKLYFVADWIDEYCDLTLQQLIDKFGQEAINANDLSVNYKPASKL